MIREINEVPKQLISHNKVVIYMRPKGFQIVLDEIKFFDFT